MKMNKMLLVVSMLSAAMLAAREMRGFDPLAAFNAVLAKVKDDANEKMKVAKGKIDDLINNKNASGLQALISDFYYTIKAGAALAAFDSAYSTADRNKADKNSAEASFNITVDSVTPAGVVVRTSDYNAARDAAIIAGYYTRSLYSPEHAASAERAAYYGTFGELLQYIIRDKKNDAIALLPNIDKNILSSNSTDYSLNLSLKCVADVLNANLPLRKHSFYPNLVCPKP